MEQHGGEKLLRPEFGLDSNEMGGAGAEGGEGEGFRADFRGGEVFWLARGRTIANCIFSLVASAMGCGDAWTTLVPAEEGR